MKIKKAILTGGGRATRLRPVTSTLNKHLIPLAGKPMIFYAIEKAVEAGITDICINIHPEEKQLQAAVGDGSHWGVRISYFVQDEPHGIAHVVKLAERFIQNDPFMFYLSDNILLGSLQPLFNEFENNQYDCMLAFSKVADPERFGVPVFDANQKLVEIIEKPASPASDFAVTGVYLYGSNVFFQAFDQIKPSARGEYEISDIHSYLLKSGKRVGWKEMTGWWKDTGKPVDLLLANQLLLDKLEDSRKVQVGAGTTIDPTVKIIAPVIIGENCTLTNCTIGPHVTVGAGSTIANATIKNSIVLNNCTLSAPMEVAESIIGAGSTVRAAGTHARLLLGESTLLEV